VNAEVQRVVGRLAALSAAADELARLPPMGVQYLMRVAQAYTMLGAHDRALEFLRRASAAAPFDASCRYGLGAALIFTGQFEEAKVHLKEAVRLQPRHFLAWYSLVDIEKQTPEANHIPALEALFAPPDVEGNRTLHLGHSLAKTYEDFGDYETAFDWLVKGKAARKLKADYSPEREDGLFAEAAQSYGHGIGQGYASEEPIFVTGMPRSATTLVEAILSAHPDVTAGGELGILPALVKHLSGGSERHILDPANIRDMAHVSRADLGRCYVEATRPRTGGTPRFTDKTPLNVAYAGLILNGLPNARVICIRRDPMDSVISFFRTMFVGTPHVYPSVYDLETAAHHFVRFHRLAEHWKTLLPPDRYTEVQYETLVADQEGETRRILEFAGLSFDPATLAFHDQANVVATASAVQVRKPIYSSAMGRWKRYGDRLKPAVTILRDAGIAVEA
jgi:tetratricopeptide (TPR) repeat protein